MGVPAALRSLTDGQRWTVGIALVVTLLFVTFGLRRAATVAVPFAAADMGEAPVSPTTTADDATAVAPGPPDVPDAGTTSGAAGTSSTPGAASSPSAPDAAPMTPAVEPSSLPIVAVVRTQDGVVRDEATVAGVFLADLDDVEAVALDDAVDALCAAPTARFVLAGEGLPEGVRDCVTGAGGVVLSHDDHGSRPGSVSTALGATAALVESAQLAPTGAAVGLVVEESFEAEAHEASEELEAEGFSVHVAVLGSGTEPELLATMLGLAGDGVETAVLGLDVATQDRWLSLARLLRMPFDHVAADIADTVVNEEYGSAAVGLRTVAATGVPWYEREHGETDSQRRCRERYRDAVGAAATSAGELAQVFVWCQHVTLAAQAVSAGGDLEEALLGSTLESPYSSPLRETGTGGYGPTEVAVLEWSPGCSCWTESQPYRPRNAP